MKKRNNDLNDLISILKVFDANYAVPEDCEKIAGLSVNDQADVKKAAGLLLIPEYKNYSINTKARLIKILENALQDEKEAFSALFNRIGLIFDDDLIDPRKFMTSIFDAIKDV